VIRRFAAFSLLVVALSSAAAPTTTVSDVTTARGTIRIAHYRPDAPSANLYVMSGGDGVLRLQANGSGTGENFLFSPLIRIRQQLLEAGYALIMIDAPSDMAGGIPFAHRVTTAHAAELLDVVRFVQQRDNLPAWLMGFSAGGPSVANVAINAPRSTPLGLILLSPNTGVEPHLLSMNLEAIQRPTLLMTNSSDTCAGTPPANGPVVMSRLAATEARRHAIFTGGSFGSRGGGCDSTGFHGLGGLDTQFVSELTGWMRQHAHLVAAPNYQALWWRSPAGSENGWGVNVTHQGDVLFATWYTYDLDGSALWLFTDAHKTTEGTYTGSLYQSRGSPFLSVPYDPSRFSAASVGTATFSFSDAGNGTFTYTVNGLTQSKPITRFVYANPTPTCIASGGTDGTNFQDLWWRSPGGSENGWGVNLVHQGDTLFATWYTYGADGTDLWMVMDSAIKIAERTYRGNVYRTAGAPFNAYDSARFSATLVGTGTFTFSDANNGTFAYTVDGVAQSKSITRYAFATPPTACAFR
jgi:hypothetical protein